MHINNKLYKGLVIRCPHCNTPLYRLNKDIDINDAVRDSLPFIQGIYPQPSINDYSHILVSCFKCHYEIDFITLMREYFTQQKKGIDLL